MILRNPKSIILLASLLLVVCNGFGFPSFPYSSIQESQENYIEVVSQGEGFIAITNKSRVDWISETGKPDQTKNIQGEQLNCLAVKEQQVIVAGNNGTLYYSQNDSLFRKIESGTTKNINCVALFRNKIIAGTDGGELRIGNAVGAFVSVQFKLKGNIVSLFAEASVCYGVSDQGEIIHSSDGENWTIFDFNEVYKGYYKACAFNKIIVTPTQIAVIGKSFENLPVLYFSSAGNVWSERQLIYTDEEGFNALLNNIPSNIYYNSSKDQFLLLCANGMLMTIPSCSHCQKLYKISDKNLYGISGNENEIIMVGDNNYIKTIKTELL
jgi:hypothetical protein